VPRGHLAAVFVADQAVGRRLVKFAHYPPDTLLGLRRHAGVVIEVRDVVRRLVAVSILADQAGYVGLFAAGDLSLGREKLIELIDKFPSAAHQLDQPRDVVRNKERVLPRVGLGVVKCHLLRSEGFDEAAVLLWPEEAGFGIEEVLKIARTAFVIFDLGVELVEILLVVFWVLRLPEL